MRVLCVTFEAPSKLYGGGWGIIQSLVSVSTNACIDYVGPEFNRDAFPEIKLRRYLPLVETKSIPAKVINLLRGVPVRFYGSWKRMQKILVPSDYDLVFVDFSYNDFVLEWAQKKGIRTVVRVHNIERDMCFNTVRTMVINKYWIRNLLNGWLVTRRERKVMQMSNQLIFLTCHDRDRALKLYGGSKSDLLMRSTIIPVCMEKPRLEDCVRVTESEYILATGSLNYGPNALGIKWFIRNVWNVMKMNHELPGIQLVVAGRKPDMEMEKLCDSAKECLLFDSPEEIEPFFRHANLYVAPIFSGAGMKVKISEALSYGLPVVGARHALMGYEEAGYKCNEANSADEFVSAIRKCYHSLNMEEREKCRDVYEEFYSMGRSIRSFRDVLNAALE